MIPPEKQVTSFILSQELKNLGIKQEGVFAWYQELDGSIFCEYCQYQTSRDNQSTYHDGYAKLPIKICIAPTVAELGEMLPEGYHSKKERNSWGCADADNHLAVTNVYDCDKIYTEAEARAKMLIYLIENKLMDVK